MFSLLQGMKWSHLPVAGGLYDQDPDLLDKFQYLFMKIQQEEARKDAEQKDKERRDAAKNQRSSQGGRGRRR